MLGIYHTGRHAGYIYIRGGYPPGIYTSGRLPTWYIHFREACWSIHHPGRHAGLYTPLKTAPRGALDPFHCWSRFKAQAPLSMERASQNGDILDKTDSFKTDLCQFDKKERFRRLRAALPTPVSLLVFAVPRVNFSSFWWFMGDYASPWGYTLGSRPSENSGFLSFCTVLHLLGHLSG